MKMGRALLTVSECGNMFTRNGMKQVSPCSLGLEFLSISKGAVLNGFMKRI